MSKIYLNFKTQNPFYAAKSYEQSNGLNWNSKSTAVPFVCFVFFNNISCFLNVLLTLNTYHFLQHSLNVVNPLCCFKSVTNIWKVCHMCCLVAVYVRYSFQAYSCLYYTVLRWTFNKFLMKFFFLAYFSCHISFSLIHPEDDHKVLA